MFFILYVIRITDITDGRNTIGPNSLFNSKSVYPQPESGSFAKNVMRKIQVHCIERVDGVCISDRKCAPLMISQPFTVVYSGIKGCELMPVAKVPNSQVHHKLTEVHRVTSHNLMFHQVRACQTIQRRQEV
eukprot:214059-Pelagomonas_calceolata.AAC.1